MEHELGEKPPVRRVGERLAAFQVPEHVRVQSDALPRTASGKIDKRAIRGAWLAASSAAAER